MIVLGIESTCDETSAGIVIDGKKIISNIIHSQIDIHKPFKGVFPELASRSHVDKIYHITAERITNYFLIACMISCAINRLPGYLSERARYANRPLENNVVLYRHDNMAVSYTRSNNIIKE